MMKVSRLSNDAEHVGEKARKGKDSRTRLKKIGMSAGVAAVAAAAAAGASLSDEFAKGKSPPNIDVIEGKAVIVQPCATFPTSHLSFSHSIRIIVEQRRELRIDDPNENSQGAATTIVMTVDDNR